MVRTQGEVTKLCLLLSDRPSVLLGYQPSGLSFLLGLGFGLGFGLAFSGFVFLIRLVLRADLSDPPIGVLGNDLGPILEPSSPQNLHRHRVVYNRSRGGRGS